MLQRSFRTAEMTAQPFYIKLIITLNVWVYCDGDFEEPISTDTAKAAIKTTFKRIIFVIFYTVYK